MDSNNELLNELNDRRDKVNLLDQAVGGCYQSENLSDHDMWGKLIRETKAKTAGKVNLLEDHDNAEEEAIRQNCKNVTDFLTCMVDYDAEKLSNKSKNYLKEMMYSLGKLKIDDREREQSHSKCENFDTYAKQGALPKGTFKPKDTPRVTPKLSNNFSFSGFSSSSDTEDSVKQTMSARHKKSTRFVPKVREPSGVKVDDLHRNEAGLLGLLLEKLDNRKTPQIRKFDPNSQSLRSYLRKFEDYCRDNIKGDETYWIDELETRLSGELLKVFKGQRNRDDYDVIKSKLLTWYDDTKDLRKSQAKLEFDKIKMLKEESLFLYSSRIESIYSRAHPRKDPETSSLLKDKFIATVPKEARVLFSSRNFNKKMKGKKLTWSEIQKCAMMQDVENNHKSFQSDSDDIEIKEIAVNFSENRSRPRHKNSYYSTNFSKINRRYDSRQTRYNNQDYKFNNHRYKTGSNMSNNNYGREYAQETDRTPRRPDFKNLRPPNFVKCHKCGRLGHMMKDCRTVIGPCFGCDRMGHIRKDCWFNSNFTRSKSQPPRKYNGSKFDYTRDDNRRKWNRSQSQNKPDSRTEQTTRNEQLNNDKQQPERKLNSKALY